MIRQRVCFLLAAGAALSASPALAQDDVDPFALSPEQLFGAEVISASRSEESVFEAPAAIYVITASDIQRSGATTIAEALRLAPGVDVARNNTANWSISVRGFNSPLANKLLVLIDGREVYDPLFSGVYWDVQDTALEDIDRIEIVRGPGASLWGANAVNGVINIITRRAAETQGALVSVVAGDYESAGVTVRYGGALGENTHWRAYGRFVERESFETAAGLDSNGDWSALRGGFRIDHERGRNSFTLQGEAYDSDAGDLRSVPSLLAPYAITTPGDVEASGAHLLGRWTRDLENDAQLTAQAYVEVTARDQLNIEDERTTFDLDLQYDFPTLGAHALVVGGRYRNTVDEVTDSAITQAAHPSNREELFSVFAQDEIALGEAWRLTVGSKFDLNEYTDLEIQPTLRMQWLNGTRQTAWASVSRAVRTPTALEREFTSALGVFPPGPPPLLVVPVLIELRPNPNFESEEVIAYEFGYRRQVTPDVAFDLALFFNDYENLATSTRLTPTLSLGPPVHVIQGVLLTNLSSAESYGAEAVVEWRLREDMRITATYSFLDLDLNAPPPAQAFNPESAEGQSPRHQANVRLQWDVNERLSLDAVAYYVDRLPNFQVDSYVRADLRAGYALTDAVEIELIGQNLFDDAHREFGGAVPTSVEVPRSVFARLTWRP